MAEQIREQISALADGELPPKQARQTIEQLRDDSELIAVWGRYHLIGEGLRRNLGGGLENQLADRVKLAIDGEPPLVGPMLRTLHFPDGLMRQAAGFAMAASVTAVAILGFQHIKRGQVPDAVVAGDTQRQQLAAHPAQPAAPMGGRHLEPQLVRDPQLVRYPDYAISGGVQEGVLPYVRIVGQEVRE